MSFTNQTISQCTSWVWCFVCDRLHRTYQSDDVDLDFYTKLRAKPLVKVIVKVIRVMNMFHHTMPHLMPQIMSLTTPQIIPLMNLLFLKHIRTLHRIYSWRLHSFYEGCLWVWLHWAIWNRYWRNIYRRLWSDELELYTSCLCTVYTWIYCFYEAQIDETYNDLTKC